MPRFQPRIRKQKARQRLQEGVKLLPNSSDSNIVEVLPEEQRRLRTKHEALRADLKAGQPAFSAKKQKRLDKYIENKLRKDESLELLKKLAATKTDTSAFRSSRSLGAGRGTKRDAIGRAALDEESSEELIRGSRISVESYTASSEDEWTGFSSDASQARTQDSSQLLHLASSKPRSLKSKNQDPFGSGLKRPLDIGMNGQPVIKKRQRLNKRSAGVHVTEDDLEMLSSSTDSLSMSSDADDESGEDSGSTSELESEPEDLPSSLFSNSRSLDAKRVSGIKEVLEDWSKTASGARDGLSNIEAMSQLPVALRESRGSQTNHTARTDSPPTDAPPPPEFRDRQSYHVPITRRPSIQSARMKLSVVAEEQKIMEAIHNHPVVVLCGPTGSGKTTQVPQFLFEAGYGTPESRTPGLIGVTQPRRVAAVTMARRVAEEMGEEAGKVSYQIRFDNTMTRHSSIKFMTDGIMLRELSEDFALTKYSAIVIDEAHERSVNTDILIGMLSRVIDLRRDMAKSSPAVSPLKLIVMSATLVAGDFISNDRLFRIERPPLIEVEGRQYDVVEHFARRTERDYLEQAFQRVTRGHRKLPPGSMLVFLTGQSEIIALSKRLKRTIGTEAPTEAGRIVRVSGKDVPLEMDDLELGEDRVEDYIAGEEIISVEAEDEDFEIDDEEASSSEAYILPLYSQLPTKEQLRVFEPPPDGTRLIILTTNIAETSITIPGIRYVFDCGRSKVKKYNSRTGVQSFEIGWISKASAAQRLGRAGRTGPGHCYRLYSSAVYEGQFVDHTPPDITTTPMESVVLQLKSMQIPGGIQNFPFPSPPEAAEIIRAEGLLASLGALDMDGKISEIGKTLSLYPISPRFARMLTVGHQNRCGVLSTALVAALATSEIFLTKSQLNLHSDASDSDGETERSHGLYDQSQRLADDARSARRKVYNSAHSLLAQASSGSDALKLLRGFGNYLAVDYSHQASISAPSSRFNLTNSVSPETECERMFMRAKACAEARNLYHQLLRLLALHHPTAGIDANAPPPKPPTEEQNEKLKQIVVTGFIDQVAIRFDLLDDPEQARLSALFPHFTSKAPRKAADVLYVPLFGEDVVASVHPSSVLAQRNRKEMPPFIVYERLQRTQARAVSDEHAPRTRLFPLTPTTGPVLRELARGTPLLEWGKPIGKIEAMERRDGQERRRVWVVPSLVNGGERAASHKRWPLPGGQIVQIRDRKGVWREEKSG